MTDDIYFFIQHYPNWKTGGLKYHSIVFEYALSHGLKVHVFGNSKIESRFFKIKILRIFYGILNILKIPKNTLILMSNASFLDYFIPIIFDKFLKRHRYFFIIHHLVQTEKPYSKSRKKLESRFIKMADGYIAVSKTTKKQLSDLNLVKEDIPVVPPGLSFRNELVPEKKIFSPIHKLLYVGTIERRKGVLDLIKALQYLSSYDIEVIIVGSVKEEDYFNSIKIELEKKSKNHTIVFYGNVDEEILIKSYLESSIFVFPSYWEGYGMVITEAMAYGLPIVASKIPSTQELVENGKEGLLFEPGSSKQLAECLKYLFDNQFKLTEFSINARKKAKTFLSWEETSKKILEIIADFQSMH